MDDEMIAMLRGSLEHVLLSDADVPFGDRLDELGWDEVVADDEAVAVRTLFEVKGATRSSVAALDHTMAAHVAARAGDPSLGRARLGFGADLWAATFATSPGRIAIDVVTLGAPTDGQPILVGLEGSGWSNLATFSCSGLDSAPIAGLDPSLGLVRSTGTADVTPIDGADPALFDDLTALGRRCLAAELVGLGEVMLRDAVQYACDRRQYGRPIGSFQAVQHRLADARAALTAAAVMTQEAFADRSPWTAQVAKALAGRGFEEVSRQCQQAYGAIGFTFEHDFHRFLRRGYLLDACLGDWRTLQERIGEEITLTRTVPRIGSL